MENMQEDADGGLINFAGPQPNNDNIINAGGRRTAINQIQKFEVDNLRRMGYSWKKVADELRFNVKTLYAWRQ